MIFFVWYYYVKMYLTIKPLPYFFSANSNYCCFFKTQIVTQALQNSWMASSCGDEVNCLGPPNVHLANPVSSWKQEAWSCKEARPKTHHKDGIYSKAAMVELLVLLYKKT